MEKCYGGDLNDLRKEREVENKPFTEIEVKLLIRAIVNAYKACIKQGILHRDIKPANILLNNKTYLLTDFGMGCIIDDFGRRRNFNRVGSPIYAAPQILHNSPYSIKCDVYSVNLMFMA
jgi:serine/threonine protein kinase